MADFPLHTNTGPWLGSWLPAIFENIKIKMKAHFWAKILRQENFQAGFPHCLRDLTIATLYLRNCLFNCTQRTIIALSASSESHHPFMCRSPPFALKHPIGCTWGLPLHPKSPLKSITLALGGKHLIRGRSNLNTC